MIKRHVSHGVETTPLQLKMLKSYSWKQPYLKSEMLRMIKPYLKRKMFNLWIKPSSKIPDEDDEIEFHHTASSLPVDTSTPSKTSSRKGAWSQHNLVLILSMISSKVSLC